MDSNPNNTEEIQNQASPAPVEVPTPQPPVPPVVSAPAVTTPVTSDDPGKVLGIVGFVLSILSLLFNFITLGLTALAGLIVSIIGFSKSKKASHKNGLAVAGIVVSAVSAFVTIVVFSITFMSVLQTVQKCHDLGYGTHVVGNQTYTCDANGSTVKSN